MVIELIERPYWVDRNYDLVLDLLPSSQLRLTETIQNLQGGSLNLSSTLPLPVAASPKNKILLGDTKKNYIRCRVTMEGQELPVTALYWYSITATEINIDLVHATRDWAKALEQKKLNEIEYRIYGSINMLKDELEDNWANGFIWQDETPPFYMPLIRYNGLLTQQYIDLETNVDFSKTDGNASVSYNDFRPLISILFTMRKMFELIGWKFKSPFLESEYGRTLFAYILKEDFAKDKGLRGNYHVSYVGSSFNAHNTNAVNFNTDTGTENFNGGQYLFITAPPAHSFYISPYIFPIKGNFKTKMILSHSYGVKKIIEVTIRVMYDTVGSVNNIFDYKKEDFVIEAGETLECLVEWDGAIILPQYRVEVRARTFEGTELSVHEGSWFSGQMADNGYYYGDLLNPQVREDSCLDFLKGVAHICNGHFSTNIAQKIVTLYPPIGVNIQGESIEGFYSIYTKDMEVATSYTLSFTNFSNKVLKLGWKTSQDIKVQDTANELYGVKSIRLNTLETSESTNYNPYFQAVFEDVILKNSPASPIVAAIITSTDDVIAVNAVEPFIVEALGGQYQSLRNDSAYGTGTVSIARLFTLIGIITETPQVYDLIPYATQQATAYAFNGTPISLRHLSTYGTGLGDFSQLFYEPFLKTSKKVEILTRDIHLGEIISQDALKTKLVVNIDGAPKVVYPTSINDYQEGITSSITGSIDILTSPIPCDGVLLKASYPVFTGMSTGAYNFDCYVESFLLQGEEQVTTALLIGNPSGMGVDAFHTALASIINLFVSSSYTNPNIYIEANKCFWFQLTLRKGTGTTLIDQFLRIDPIGTWVNTSLNSGASTDLASWRIVFPATDKIERYV